MGLSTKMTHPGRYGCGERRIKNNSSTEGWSWRLVMCHTCLLFLKITPVRVESGMMAADTQTRGKIQTLALAKSSFQKRCSRCPLRQGFQGHEGLFMASSLKLVPYSPYQSATTLANTSEALHIGLLLTIHSKVVGNARMFRLCFLLLYFLFLLFCRLLYGGRDLVCPVSSSILSVQHRVGAK